MERLANTAGSVGWLLIAVGFFLLGGGGLAWAADYMQSNAAGEANWLSLMVALACGMALSFLGVSLLAVNADRKRMRRRISTKDWGDPLGSAL